ncbi:hypothetical protein NKH77_20410 [Streptomyces sp. M19]
MQRALVRGPAGHRLRGGLPLPVHGAAGVLVPCGGVLVTWEHPNPDVRTGRAMLLGGSPRWSSAIRSSPANSSSTTYGWRAGSATRSSSRARAPSPGGRSSGSGG